MTDPRAKQPADGSELPTGTVTFFFTDIEGSTKLLQELGQKYRTIQDDHARIIRDAISRGGGREIRTEGDSFFAVFPTPTGALHAAVSAQRELATHSWSHGRTLRVRMGLHTGEGTLGGDDYLGIDVNRAARIAAAGHGGQVLVSDATRALVEHALPEGVSVRDLGTHRLKDLAHPEHIFDLVIEGLPPDFPLLKSLDARPNNLPVQLTSFVGRLEEIDAVGGLVRRTRLVTLSGPGGSGKTRLALEVARETLADFPDGAFFVDLAAITDPELVPSAVAQALDIPGEPAGSWLDTLINHLSEKNVLLVLDNFEQVTEAARDVEVILRRTRDVHILVTSRVVLHVSGEHEFHVEPLHLPDPRDLPDAETLSQFDAVALFIHRARAVKEDFMVTNQNAPAVAEICARLDGLPLAIELAASRVKLLTPEAILARLGHRLPLLTSATRNVPERQRTLRGTIDWSYELLGEPERRLLSRLAVFASGCTFEAVDSVCNPNAELRLDTLDALSSLVDKSLVRQTEMTAAEPRFRMLETIREYSSERLTESGELNDIAGRHARYFMEFSEAAEPHLLAHDQVIWLNRCDLENDNIRAALQWCIDTEQPETGLRIGAALWRFWQQRGHLREGRRWLDRLLALPGANERSAITARAHGAAGGLAYWDADYKVTRRHYEEALEIFRELGDKFGIERALYDLSFVYMIDGDLETHGRLLEESLALARELDDKEGVLNAMDALGYLFVLQRRPAEALRVGHEAIALAESMGNAFHLIEATTSLGQAYRLLGDLDRADEYVKRGIAMHRDAGNIAMTTYMIFAMSTLEGERGRHLRSMRLYGVAEGLLERYANIAPADAIMMGDPVGAARAVMGDQAVDTAIAEGRSMDPEEAVAYALSDSE
ncbi:MAG TPA: adenylate/guanylate cyclase domain-containing protein [Actinomycetota bacterium]|nr:adenylate/guanylate cyclase domain-containing protein [Actinomycetota bacterium]